MKIWKTHRDLPLPVMVWNTLCVWQWGESAKGISPMGIASSHSCCTNTRKDQTDFISSFVMSFYYSEASKAQNAICESRLLQDLTNNSYWYILLISK